VFLTFSISTGFSTAGPLFSASKNRLQAALIAAILVVVNGD
jgi:hypothetical protein